MLGVHLTLLMGPAVPLPAPPELVERLEGVEVTHQDEGRSGFQLSFRSGRSGPASLVEDTLLQSPLIAPFTRVILVVTFGARPRVLMDGVVTNVQFSPGNQPGSTTVSLTGEDVSVMMDLEQRRVPHPAQDDTTVALKIISSYPHLGLIPRVTPPLLIDPPVPAERVPVQTGTDLAHLKQLAERHGYVFYVSPGDAPGTNYAWWGPPQRAAAPQRALSVNLGYETNVESVQFQYNALEPQRMSGTVLDRRLNQEVPYETFFSTRLPPLALLPALPAQLPNVRKSALESPEGATLEQALARAQAATDASLEKVLTASGELNALRYGDLLEPRGVVGLRGAGLRHDGLYYVKSVTHQLRRGEYKQRFTLTREGYVTTTPVVRP